MEQLESRPRKISNHVLLAGGVIGGLALLLVVSLVLGGATLHLHTTSMLSGVLLIGMGYLLASGQLTTITQLAAGSDLSLWGVEMEERMQGWLGFQ